MFGQELNDESYAICKADMLIKGQDVRNILPGNTLSDDGHAGKKSWYPKPAPTFADALARLRQHLWFERIVTSAESTDMTDPLAPAIQRIIEAACYAP